MERVLVSACLLGNKVRYDGRALSSTANILEQWISHGRVVSVCPEVDGGMSIPRAPAEILEGNGFGVWKSTSKVFDVTGVDVTKHFIKGAQIALELCQKYNIKVAVLSEDSPSCGSSTIYDGSFTGKKIGGLGVTSALLRLNGIEVFSQDDFDTANKAVIKYE